jgi:hypothetical protein
MGQFRWRSGHHYEGPFVNGHEEGAGVFSYSDGRVYEGQHTAGKENGYGVMWDAQGRVVQAGRWQMGTLVQSLSASGGQQQQQQSSSGRAWDVGQLNPNVRAIVTQARANAERGRAAQQRAREAAQRGRSSGRNTPSSGYGVTQWTTGEFAGYSFEGEFRNNNFAVGILYFANTAIARDSVRDEADFVNNIGAMYYRNGSIYYGEFPDDKKTGPGVMEFSDGSRYEGGWVNDLRSGYGVVWDAQGRVVQQGIWSNGDFTTPLR